MVYKIKAEDYDSMGDYKIFETEKFDNFIRKLIKTAQERHSGLKYNYNVAVDVTDDDITVVMGIIKTTPTKD